MRYETITSLKLDHPAPSERSFIKIGTLVEGIIPDTQRETTFVNTHKDYNEHRGYAFIDNVLPTQTKNAKLYLASVAAHEVNYCHRLSLGVELRTTSYAPTSKLVQDIVELSTPDRDNQLGLQLSHEGWPLSCPWAAVAAAWTANSSGVNLGS